jgi:hypothetical protein
MPDRTPVRTVNGVFFTTNVFRFESLLSDDFDFLLMATPPTVFVGF